MNDEWANSVGRFGSTTSQLLAGIRSGQSEAMGWNAIISAGLVPTDLRRLDATHLIVHVPQFAAYEISEPETVTLSIPANALRSGQPIAASMSFVVQALAGTAQLHGPLLFDTRELRFHMNYLPPSAPPPLPPPSLPPAPPRPPSLPPYPPNAAPPPSLPS